MWTFLIGLLFGFIFSWLWWMRRYTHRQRETLARLQQQAVIAQKPPAGVDQAFAARDQAQREASRLRGTVDRQALELTELKRQLELVREQKQLSPADLDALVRQQAQTMPADVRVQPRAQRQPADAASSGTAALTTPVPAATLGSGDSVTASHIGSLRSTIERQATELKQLKAQLNRLGRQSGEDNSAAALKRVRADLEREREIAEGLRRQSRADLERERETAESLRRELAAAREQLAQPRVEQEANPEQANALGEELTQLRRQLGEERQAADAARREREQQTRELAEAREQLEALRERAAAADRLAELQSELGDCVDERQQLERELELERQALTAAKAENEDKDRQLAEARERLASVSPQNAAAAGAERADTGDDHEDEDEDDDDEGEIDIEALKASLPKSTRKPDNLKKIKGIGEKIERLLNRLGIHTFEQIASLDRRQVNQIARALKVFPDRVKRDDWVSQARTLNQKYHGG